MERAEMIVAGGMFQYIKGWKHCLCPDGKRRYVRATTGYADTFFSVPASVTIKGTTISGYVTGRETEGEQDYEFRVVQGRKHSDFFKGQA